MKSTATSSDCRLATSSEPMPSSTPVIASISPSTWAPTARACATTSIIWRRFSSTGCREASNSTEFQPLRRQSVMTSRSGQWSRCRQTGTSIPAVIVSHMPYRTSSPIDRTVLTEVWTMSGERCSTAAASTASSVRSLKMLMAATPYRSASARSTMSFNGTTGTIRTYVWLRRRGIGGTTRLGVGISPCPARGATIADGPAPPVPCGCVHATCAATS